MTRTVLFNGVPTRMAVDDPRPSGAYAWAVALARFVDEATGSPILSGVSVETDFPNLNGRASGAAGGLYGFPSEAFPLLASQKYDLSMRVWTNDHVPETVAIEVPQRTDAFTTFETVPLGDVVLHRRPTVVTGRVLRRDTGTPVMGASVRVTKAWRILPTPTGAAPAETAALVSLWPPLPFALDDATASVRRRNLTPVAGGAQPLIEPAQAGNRQIVVAGASGTVAIDSGVSDRLEYASVVAVDGSVVTLARPLNFDHRVGALVGGMTVGGLGAAKAVVHGGLPEDVAVYLSDASNLSTGDQVRIQSPGEADSVHRVALLEATTDARGVFVLPALNRAGQIELTFSSGVLGPTTLKVAISLSARQSCGDLLL